MTSEDSLDDAGLRRVYGRAMAAQRTAGELLARTVAAAEVGVVVVIDIDSMGVVNARYGTGVGDRLLHAVEADLRGELRELGEVARMAGDQFIVVVPGRPLGSEVVAEVLRAVRGAGIRSRSGRPIRVTACAGFARWGQGQDPGTVLAAAGAELSFAKALSTRAR